jgi:ribosomal protein S27AE
MSALNFYLNREVALLTQHGKQNLLKAPLENALSCRLVHTQAYNTDLLGTFTRDQIRSCSQLEAARKKAVIGMSFTNTSIGIGSEGSFGMDPFGGFVPWNTEVVVWVDQELAIEVVGIAQGPTQSLHKKIHSTNELEIFAKAADFPEHHLALRPQNEDHQDIIKGIDNFEDLLKAFNWAKQKSSDGFVFVENDLRAHCNPTRQFVILQAADNLIQKLLSTCPQCHTPGYWMAGHTKGLPCAACGRKTHLPICAIWRCSLCNFEDHQRLPIDQLADPSRCDFCNP